MNRNLLIKQGPYCILLLLLSAEKPAEAPGPVVRACGGSQLYTRSIAETVSSLLADHLRAGRL